MMPSERGECVLKYSTVSIITYVLYDVTVMLHPEREKKKETSFISSDIQMWFRLRSDSSTYLNRYSV